jgi:hypothetical protein
LVWGYSIPARPTQALPLATPKRLLRGSLVREGACELPTTEYASRRGWTITSEYVDQGVSGSKESRPELNQLMADAHRRKFDAVLVWKIDRFGRSLKHLVNALADLCA